MEVRWTDQNATLGAESTPYRVFPTVAGSENRAPTGYFASVGVRFPDPCGMGGTDSYVRQLNGGYANKKHLADYQKPGYA